MKKIILAAIMSLSTLSAFAAPVDMSALKMVIIGQSCNGVKLELNGNEMLQTTPKKLMLISKFSEDENQICIRADGYFKMTVGSDLTNEVQTEFNELYKRDQRTVCLNKTSKEMTSDVTEIIDSSDDRAVLAELNFKNSHKTLTLQGHEQCLGGKLVLELL